VSFPRPFYRWRPHPWHGLEPGKDPPRIVHAYIEITPFDSVKYEVDKETGYLLVDRPQRTSSQPPTLYGFIPRTFCGERVARLSPETECADGDPLDICVVSERPINRGEVVLSSRVVGGLKMIDQKEADDKIVAVLENDNIWGDARDIGDLPNILIERLSHYFLTYKLVPGTEPSATIKSVFGVDHAHEIIRASLEDYTQEFGE
jgi:inorganic pyrophosphatase